MHGSVIEVHTDISKKIIKSTTSLSTEYTLCLKVRKAKKQEDLVNVEPNQQCVCVSVCVKDRREAVFKTGSLVLILL